MSVLSVDLGTSNTVAVLAAHGRPPRLVEVEGSAAMPSAVFAAAGVAADGAEGDGRLVVGKEAERRARLDPARFEPNPKRRVDEGTLLLGDRVVAVTEAFAAVLGKVGEETTRQLGGARPDEVRLTHPAQWGPVRRNVLLSAARRAGLGANLILVPEPVAAAAHFASFPGRTLAPGQALAVYDLGAGTFDMAIVGATQNGFVVLAEAGLPDLGGLDVDQALLEHVGRQVSARDPGHWQRLLKPQSTADRRAQRALREDVRAAKEALSGHPQTEVPLPEPFGDVLVTRAELEILIRPNLLRSVEMLDATVRSAGLGRERLAGVYLVGGSSRIPLAATLISEQLRIVPTNLDQPETAVALGAHHVSAEGTSLRTANLPDAMPALAGSDQATTSITPPPRPPAAAAVPHSHPATSPPVLPMPVGQPRPAAPVHPVPPSPARPLPTSSRSRRLPWLIGAVAVAVLVLVATALVVLPGRGGAGSAAATDPTTTDTRSTETSPTETTSTSASPTTTDTGDVVVNQPKAVNSEDDCAELITPADVTAALATPARPSASGHPCFFVVDFPGATDSSQLVVRIRTSEPYQGDKIDFEGNTAYQDGEAVAVISTSGGGRDAPHCEVSVALDPDTSQPDEAEHWLVVEITADTGQATVDLCDGMWTLTKIAFDKLPNA